MGKFLTQMEEQLTPLNKALLGKLSEGFDAVKELAHKQLEFSIKQLEFSAKQVEVLSGAESERVKAHEDGQTNRHNHSETEQTERTKVICAHSQSAATNSTAVLPEPADAHEAVQLVDSVTHGDSANSDGHVLDACPAQRLFRTSATRVPKAVPRTREEKSRSGTRTSGESGESGESGSEFYRLKNVDPDHEAAYLALRDGDFVVHIPTNQAGMIKDIFLNQNQIPGDDKIRVEKMPAPQKKKSQKTVQYNRKTLRLATVKEKQQAIPKAPNRGTGMPINPAARADQKSGCPEAYPTLKPLPR